MDKSTHRQIDICSEGNGGTWFHSRFIIRYPETNEVQYAFMCVM